MSQEKIVPEKYGFGTCLSCSPIFTLIEHLVLQLLLCGNAEEKHERTDSIDVNVILV